MAEVRIGQTLELQGKTYRVGRIDHHRYAREASVSSGEWVKPEISYIYIKPGVIGEFRQGEVVVETMDYLWVENVKDSLDTLFLVIDYEVKKGD